jgi:hypothetical protein
MQILRSITTLIINGASGRTTSPSASRQASQAVTPSEQYQWA